MGILWYGGELLFFVIYVLFTSDNLFGVCYLIGTLFDTKVLTSKKKHCFATNDHVDHEFSHAAYLIRTEELDWSFRLT